MPLVIVLILGGDDEDRFAFQDVIWRLDPQAKSCVMCWKTSHVVAARIECALDRRTVQPHVLRELTC
jgi:hypothetical protein